jgi:hypothetical protein
MTKKRTPAETWKALEDLSAEDDAARILAASDADITAELTAAGVDTAAVATRGADFIARLTANREKQSDAADRLRRARTLLASRPARRGKIPRDELEKRVETARRDPRFSAPAAILFRNRETGEATDDELEELLGVLDALAEIVAEDHRK